MKAMPLHIIYPEQNYINGMDILPETIYQHSPGETPATPTPGPQDVKDMVGEIKVEGYTHVLAFCISNGLSGTYNTVASVLGDKKDLTFFALDTRKISFGAGILAVWVEMQLEEGKSFDELKGMLPGRVKGSKVLYYMDALTCLRRGGRIGLITFATGSILNIKPIISCNGSGVYYTTAKVRGARRGLSRLLAEASSFAGSRPCLTALLSDQGQEAPDELRPRLITRIPEGHLITEEATTASLAVRTGPGLVGISVLRL